MTQQTCTECGGTETTYQAFTRGREYYCPDCDEVFPYEPGQAPPRVQMLADGRFDELRAEMRGHLANRPGADEEPCMCGTEFTCLAGVHP